MVEWIRANWLFVAFLLGLALVFLIFRTRPTADIDSLSTLETRLNSGQPVVLEFYSNL